MIISIYRYFFPRDHDIRSTREYTTNCPALPENFTNKFHPKLKVLFLQLDAIAPRFVMKKNEIEVIISPSIFYETLKSKIASSKDRIFLSSLYIGKNQQELVGCIDEALKTNEELKVYILVDALRGTREAPNNTCSADLLVPLVEKHGKHRVDIRMYHTPHLKGLVKYWIPKRINEGWGLQHMKLYGFDDEIILSGANLSTDYFTDRQDRYYLFKKKELVDYYFDIHKAVSSLSYQLFPSTKNKLNFRLSWPTSNSSSEPHLNIERFISDSSYLLEPLLRQNKLKSFEEYTDTENYDTIVYPISQFTPLMQPDNDQSTEKPAVLRLLSYLDSARIRWWFTAGYFNMLPEIQERLINGKAEGTVITASPQANSFYKSPGLSYYIPQAYLLFAKRFLEEVSRRGKESLIKLFEWRKGTINTPGGWSYHAKGLWMTVPEEDVPSITVIGSSNYTKRAYLLDLESNALIITKDSKLKEQMKHEINNILLNVSELKLSDFELKQQDANLNNGDDIKEPIYDVDEDRRISYKVHLAVKLLGDKL